MPTVQEVQSKIFEEINNPDNKTHLRVQKKEIERIPYLKEIENRCKKENLKEEEIQDILYLVDKSLWGFGILDDLVNDTTISDIRLIDESNIRIKRMGKRLPTNIKFASKKEYLRYIEFITNRNNTTISVTNAAQVFTDKDTCPTDILRFTLSSELVLTSERPTLLIRKIPKIKKTFNTLVETGYCTKTEADYLEKRWSSGHSILVAGPNGAGKTTLLNAILESTPKDKAVNVIQESEELFCETHPEMVFKKVIPQKSGSMVSYSLKDLTKLALMESFDIIVIGEIKGEEAAALSYATYTGSQVMTSVHAISAYDAYDKLIDYSLEAQPNRSRTHFAKQLQAIDTVVYVSDYKIKQICELESFDKRTGEFNLREIYHYDK